MKTPKCQQGLEKDLSDGYNESGRKTKAFYITLGTVVVLFIGATKWWGSVNEVIDSIIQLASIYIGGMAITDSVRYNKFGSKTLGNPEKLAMTTKELQDRYGDK